MNIQQTIVKGIQELLYFNNYLVLPGFGGLILKKFPAHFSASGGMLMPPSKVLSFNAQLKQNDGLLVHWLKGEIKCSDDEALQHLNGFAEYCRSILQNKGRLSLEGIGFFYTDFEKNICFEPQQQTNFLASSFGLTPVAVKEIESLQESINTTAHTDRILTAADVLQTQQNSSNEKTLRRYRKIAVLAVSGLVLVSALFFTVANTKLNGQLKASLFGQTSVSAYSPITYPSLVLQQGAVEKSDYVADANGIATVKLGEKILAVRAMDVLPGVTTTKVVAARSSGNYEVVLGCFSIHSNAKKLIRKLKSEHQIQAFISERQHKGMYVVTGGGFSSKEEALQALPRLQSAIGNAWIKKAD